MSPAIAGAERSGYWSRLRGVLTVRGGLLVRVLAANLRLGHATETRWRERHRQALEGMKAGDPILLPARQWTILSVFFRLVLRGLGLAGFKATFGRFLAAYEPHHPKYFRALHHLYRNSLRPRDVWGLLDSLEEPLLGGGDAVPLGGKRLSLDLLQSIDEFYRLKEVLGFERSDALVFCELGAGYGRLADVVLSAMPNASYLIFDLPESLTLSQYYLTTLHPDWTAALYPESEKTLSCAKALSGTRLAFGLPHQLSLLPPGAVNVFINIYSFMEMSSAQIAVYFDLIDRMKTGALFLKQHEREVNVLDKSLNARGAYPLRPAWKPLYEGTSALYDDDFEAVYRLEPSTRLRA